MESAFSREREIAGEVYCKELAHAVTQPGKVRSCRVDSQAGSPGELALQLQQHRQHAGDLGAQMPFLAKGHMLENSFLLGQMGLCILYRPSTCGMRLSHITQGNVLTQKPLI